MHPPGEPKVLRTYDGVVAIQMRECSDPSRQANKVVC